MNRLIAYCTLLVCVLLATDAGATNRDGASAAAAADRETWVSGAGLVRLALTDVGRTGNALSNRYVPSLRYPVGSSVEHLYIAGLWIGARRPDGDVHVSSAAEDYANLNEADELREFAPTGDPARVMSSVQNSDDYHPDALAPYHFQCTFHDDRVPAPYGHVPLGVEITLDALAWDTAAEDDGVVLQFTITNISGADLRDVYVGYFADATVGNTELTDPYDPQAPVGWNYYDDLNGAWRPYDFPGESDVWLMWKHDGDGEDGQATSWVGHALLGADRAVEPPNGQPPVSYNAWRFRGGPPEDDLWLDDDQEWQPGKYQVMSNGHFDVGYVDGVDYSIMSDWLALISTGPFPVLAAGETVAVTFAAVCGVDSLGLRDNAQRLGELYANGYVDAEDVPPAGMARLLPPAPNPFNPTTTIAFELAEPSRVALDIVGIDGRPLRTLAGGERSAGLHHVRWNGLDDRGRALPSGVYLVQLRTGDEPGQTRPVTLVR